MNNTFVQKLTRNAKFQKAVKEPKTIVHFCMPHETAIRHTPALATFLKVLPSMSNLKVLDLDGCLIGDNGVKLLVDCLNESKLRLEILNLSQNDLDCDGFNYLSEMFHSRAKLKVLHLYHNPINMEGNKNIGAFLRAVSSSETIEKIDFQHSYILENDANLDVVEDIILFCPSLSLCEIEFGPSPDIAVHRCRKAHKSRMANVHILQSFEFFRRTFYDVFPPEVWLNIARYTFASQRLGKKYLDYCFANKHKDLTEFSREVKEIKLSFLQ
ncbi:hypothetical protein ROZALSC1DRAFT_27726 [Rozella allomycis CSF55]|uniref:RNI-like protein n=1 Tax=Rozella allomycis (strain CSF55) TaxID=988480 RepID=A0A4P9YNH9_ROZAC|nr:hypothetical protein ROZALSC1DRAFT_27726 [Rozella allomycis CSF55]